MLIKIKRRTRKKEKEENIGWNPNSGGNNRYGVNGRTIEVVPPIGAMTQAQRLEFVLLRYLDKEESNGSPLVLNVADTVRENKPERILDLAIKMLPKQVDTSAPKVLAPIIIQIDGDVQTITAPSNDNTVEGAVVG